MSEQAKRAMRGKRGSRQFTHTPNTTRLGSHCNRYGMLINQSWGNLHIPVITEYQKHSFFQSHFSSTYNQVVSATLFVNFNKKGKEGVVSPDAEGLTISSLIDITVLLRESLVISIITAKIKFVVQIKLHSHINLFFNIFHSRSRLKIASNQHYCNDWIVIQERPRQNIIWKLSHTEIHKFESKCGITLIAPNSYFEQNGKNKEIWLTEWLTKCEMLP